ncbi:MAG: Cof-type HAD-IIB family hydrolase, partial [Myxococcota bacterium]|nr:Cof-type HAD-IIB family hydrolase [Myxococcota bacterium]
MRYFALATDYDGTLASQGVVDDATVRALKRFVASGRKLVLVTGRQLDELEQVFPHLALFERVVAENGAVLFTPSSREVRALEPPPNPAWIAELKARGVEPLAVGHVIVATREPHEATVLDVIRAMGLELHVEFNKGSVMVLPAGVTKATGLAAALLEMGLSPHNVVGVGDAENDHALLGLSECGVSVANALPSLKDRSDWVTSATHGAGVAELIDRLLADDLRARAPVRRRIHVGKDADGQPLSLEPYGRSVLITGFSRPARGAIATALLERLRDAHYQLCLVDPDGTHDEFPAGAVVGGEGHPPAVEDVARSLADPRRSVVANLAAMPLEGRAPWFAALL